jgi:hypothetical protein
MVFGGTAARSAAIATPTEGMLAVTTDNDEIDYYNGSAWVPALPVGAWTSWAPTLATGWANGNGVWDAKYAQFGKTVHVSVRFVIGTTTTKGTDLTFNLPVTAASNNSQSWIAANLRAGGVTYLGWVNFNSTTSVKLLAPNVAATYIVASLVTATVPGTWVTGESFTADFTYQAA